ncbi:expressed protein [Phakopsora pachyrhizi]|uniref:Expressed protein n=1 Tax=Phakopsora pachyrhizi TaxID=170000 RepID=A0A0S1MKB8_PHAPC|nr:expressed protein [Phakopsora pachyrhizi]
MVSSSAFRISIYFLIFAISCLINQSVEAALIKRQNIQTTLHTSCANKAVFTPCNETLNRLITTQRIKTFTTEHQFYTENNCKITWWTDSPQMVSVTNEEALKVTLQEVQKACDDRQIGINSDNPGEGFYVGKIGSDDTLVVQFNTDPF